MVDQPFDYGPPTAVLEEAGSGPQSFVLGQTYPNPFNPATLIEYRLPREGQVRLEVLDAAGQRVEGAGRGLAASRGPYGGLECGRPAWGVYFYRFWTEGFTQTRKMLLIC